MDWYIKFKYSMHWYMHYAWFEIILYMVVLGQYSYCNFLA